MTTIHPAVLLSSGQEAGLELSQTVPRQTTSGQHENLLLRYLNPAPQFELVGVHHPGREEAEAFVAQRYQSAYGAHVNQFMPWLLTLRCLGAVSGVAGLRPADHTPLFLERYLDQAIETQLAESGGEPVKRNSIVEIGNLAASQRGASHILFLLFSALLHRAGYEWITFTATKALRNNLEKLGFPLITLKEADTNRLSATELAAWGTYYDTAPLVMAGRLSTAMELIQSRPLLRRVLRLYRYNINLLTHELGAR